MKSIKNGVGTHQDSFSPVIGEYTTSVKDTEADRQHKGSDGKLRGRSKRSNEPSPTADTEIEVRDWECVFLCVGINPRQENYFRKCGKWLL